MTGLVCDAIPAATDDTLVGVYRSTDEALWEQLLKAEAWASVRPMEAAFTKT